jgi:uncharacterized membrane protein YoaK (UPF0700 family)
MRPVRPSQAAEAAPRERSSSRMRARPLSRARQSTPPWDPRTRRQANEPALRRRNSTPPPARPHAADPRPLTNLPPREQWTAALLAAIAGGVDAAGWFCLAGLLPSHLTASLVMLGARVGEYEAADLRARVLMLPVFVLTVAAVKWSARWMRAHRLPELPILLSVLTLGLAAFCSSGVLSDSLLTDDPRVLLVIGGLGVASMAVQNTIMRLCMPQLSPTTVMTGNLTQLVMSLVDLLARRGAGPDPRIRLTGAGMPLLGFLLGSISCGLIASRHGLLCLFLPLALSLMITLRAWHRHAHEQARQPGALFVFPQLQRDA